MRSDSNILIKIRIVFGIALLMVSTTYSFSQRNATTEKPFQFSGALNLTTKGISTIPSYSLGKPAMILSLTMGKKFTFEPEFRYSLYGEPWMILLWGRYELLNREKFQMNIGINPSLFFRDLSTISTDSTTDALVLQRSITADINPSYQLTKNISFGIYYMYIWGIESFASKNTHYLAFRVGIHDLNIYEKFYLSINPQIYYLKVDKEDGYFISSTMSLKRQGFPLSLHSQLSKKIQSNIGGASDFLWNVSLRYSFAHKFNNNVEP